MSCYNLASLFSTQIPSFDVAVTTNWWTLLWGEKKLLAHYLIPVLCIQLYLNFSAKILIDFCSSWLLIGQFVNTVIKQLSR